MRVVAKTEGNMDSSPTLSILMLMHDDGKYLERCLESIEKNVSCTFEVILVDNASIEQVPEIIRSRYPWMKVIRSERNLGFNAGNNLAAKNAKGKYILLLNIDTELLTDVKAAVQLLASEPQIGVVGAQAHGPTKDVRPSAGHYPSAWRLWLFRSLWVKPNERYGPDQWQAFCVDWVEGSFLMTRLENWNQIGGFEESYFLFGNDLHFCRSAAERGLAVVHCASVKYVHYCGFGTSRIGNLYAGFREYHRKFSTPMERKVADGVLRTGLIVRILVYGVWYAITRDARIRERLRGFVDVRKNWAQLTP
jgi:GT2 family glycosyltransferase